MPYRGYTRRLKRWSQKFDPDTIRNRFEQVRAVATDQVEEQFGRIVDFELAIKGRLNDIGVASILMPFYLNVGRMIYRAMTRHTGATLESEVRVIKATWTARGLDPALVDEVIKIMIGYVPY